MADKNSKVAKNVAGKYYVDTNCIFCGQCKDLAPEFFTDDTESGYMYVQKQPADQAGIALCEQAVGICPVEAIGNDGE